MNESDLTVNNEDPSLCDHSVDCGRFILTGKWRDGRRVGNGAIAGRQLEEHGVTVIMGNYRAGILQVSSGLL